MVDDIRNANKKTITVFSLPSDCIRMSLVALYKITFSNTLDMRQFGDGSKVVQSKWLKYGCF